MPESNEEISALREQVKSSYTKVQYTYVTHQKQIYLLSLYSKIIKWCQIILTAASTVGFVKNNSRLGGICSGIALVLTLASLNFRPEDTIPSHCKFVDQLWPIVQSYESLLVDSKTSLSKKEIEEKRDRLLVDTKNVYNSAPRTGKWDYCLAKKAIEKNEEQLVSEGETEKKFGGHLK